MKKILGLIFVFMFLVAGIACYASEDENIFVGASAKGTLTVTGEATVVVPADMAIVRVGVRATNVDVSDLQNTINTGIASVREALVGFGIDNDDITTSSLSIYPNYSYDADDRIVSYTGYNTLCVVVNDISQTGQVIDLAFGAGANTLDNVSFDVKDNSEAKDKAYAEAVADAMHKAKVIAEAAGTGCSSIHEISTGTSYNYYENDARMYKNAVAMEDSAMDVGTDINAAGIYVSASVNMVFGLIGE